MNDDTNQQILTELKRLRRSSNFSAIFCLVLVVAAAIYLPLRLRSLSESRQPRDTEPSSWAAVQRATDRFEYDEASRIAQRIVQKYPNDYYGYAYLGNIALARGQIKEAETYYTRAYELLPSEEYEKMLRAIRKRIEMEASNQPTATK